MVTGDKNCVRETKIVSLVYTGDKNCVYTGDKNCVYGRQKLCLSCLRETKIVIFPLRRLVPLRI